MVNNREKLRLIDSLHRCTVVWNPEGGGSVGFWPNSLRGVLGIVRKSRGFPFSCFYLPIFRTLPPSPLCVSVWLIMLGIDSWERLDSFKSRYWQIKICHHHADIVITWLEILVCINKLKFGLTKYWHFQTFLIPLLRNIKLGFRSQQIDTRNYPMIVFVKMVESKNQDWVISTEPKNP